MCRTIDVPDFNPQTHPRRMITLRTSESVLYTVDLPLSAVNGLSRLTIYLRRARGRLGRLDSKIFESANPFRIESNRIGRPIRIRIESRSFAGP